jgi:hypothetical protein
MASVGAVVPEARVFVVRLRLAAQPGAVQRGALRRRAAQW